MFEVVEVIPTAWRIESDDEETSTDDVTRSSHPGNRSATARCHDSRRQSAAAYAFRHARDERMRTISGLQG
jgi:hypothetical protein